MLDHKPDNWRAELRGAVAAGQPSAWSRQVAPAEMVAATLAAQSVVYACGSQTGLLAFGSYMPADRCCVVMLGPTAELGPREPTPEQPFKLLREELEAAGLLGDAEPSPARFWWRVNVEPASLLGLAEATLSRLRGAGLELAVNAIFIPGLERSVVTVLESPTHHALRVERRAAELGRRS